MRSLYFLSVVAVTVFYLVYHMLAFSNWEYFSSPYVESLLFSALVCIVAALYPSFVPGPLSPPRNLAILLLVFFPIFSLAYISTPDLGKWYLRYYSSTDFEKNLAIATFYTVISLPLFVIGYGIGEQSAATSSRPSDKEVFRTTRLGYFLVLLVIAMGFVGMIIYAGSIGGIGVVISEMQSISNRIAWREISSRWYYAGMVLMTAPAVLALAAIYQKKSLTHTVATAGLMVLASAILIITQASREKAIFPLILFAVALFVFRRKDGRSSYGMYIAAIIVICILVSAFVAQSFLRSGSDGTFDITDILSDFNRLDVTAVMFVDYFTAGNDLLFGLPLLAYPNQFMVKLFEFEPIYNTSALLHRFIFLGDLNAGNPGSPLAGELYMNFGLAGFLLFPIFGFVLARMYVNLHKSNYAFWNTIFFVVTLYFFVFKMCIYTGLSESILMMALVYLPLLFWKYMLRVRA